MDNLDEIKELTLLDCSTPDVVVTHVTFSSLKEHLYNAMARFTELCSDADFLADADKKDIGNCLSDMWWIIRNTELKHNI